ncbi:hypothetical protein AOC36_10195 [Erysipelothrix larvae]|uniref:NgoFVII family restriction endonuclease n=1 Tax=Erysipelothrix larvae TaxID=1514105 RepID=A0A0X8H1G2_9FIRM|nr:DEAD/DEAH box helicase [Erysipelothrix larvae]AMC94328.1 hypothetical protein AOC36_10195 [Erysipelothrix larvae]
MELRNIEFISNDHVEGTKVLKVIRNEMAQCDRFDFSVAFITQGGLTMLANQLLSLQNRNIKGRILTSTYQHFNDPKVYEKLMSYPNIECRIYSLQDHHTKGYIFGHGDDCKVIIGSSNLTQAALAINREWNLEVSTKQNSKLVSDVESEFERMWHDAEILDTSWIEHYKKAYHESRIIETKLKAHFDTKEPFVVPNVMQSEALRNLDKLRSENVNKALLISATGTGKTYLSAFDVRNAKADKVLFIIHREQIARDAQRTFKHVLPDKTSGFITGSKKDYDKDIVFTTIQSISQDYNLHNFAPDHFDYIIYDEAHRSGANSYQKVMDYFTPKFTLGMSATPERSDMFNIFELFDYNIAYEIRLKDALQLNMLTPFHYFGVSDVTLNGEVIDDQASIAQLVSKHRVDAIIEKTTYYGYSGDRVKGLIFCSRNEEASKLSAALNQRGLRTVALCGADSQQYREHSIHRLTSNDGDLDYIITVDIFNEGIDIPQINQIVMLRPTQSATIFVQQLGRGLRKNASKDFVVVIDFVGNYKNNFLIPIALSGDKSMSKNTLRKFVMEGSSLIPGTSTIDFDEITKQRIYNAIDQTKLSSMHWLKKEYEALKSRIGRIPNLLDYEPNGSIDPQVIFSGTRYRSHYEFLNQGMKEDLDVLNELQHKLLAFVSMELSSGKRCAELKVLKTLCTHDSIPIQSLNQAMTLKQVQSILRVLTLEFLTDVEKKPYQNMTLITLEKDVIKKSQCLTEALTHPEFSKHFMDDLDYALLRHTTHFHNHDEVGFVVGQQYTRKDASWLLNWNTNQQSTIYGYKVDKASKTIPIFVTYSKSHDIVDSIDYDDHFLDREHFNWMSRNKRTLESQEIQSIINAQTLGYTLLLFVKRSDGEDKYFFYLGTLSVLDYEQTTIHANGSDLPIVRFTFKLNQMIKDDLYYYFIEG